MSLRFCPKSSPTDLRWVRKRLVASEMDGLGGGNGELRRYIWRASDGLRQARLGRTCSGATLDPRIQHRQRFDASEYEVTREGYSCMAYRTRCK